ncbi:hypothetical protein Q3G72_021862 [Acer saccharum]|nr:hypothetical protein Q3G72_021862 [Acer saccharum]
MVEEIPNEAETSQSENGSGNDRYEDEEKDPQPKPVTGNNSMLLINNKVGPFYRTLCDRFGLLRCYCWNFLVCLFYRLCAVYGETNIIQPCISPEKFNATNQASEETMVESYTKFPNEADTSARGSGKSAHFINNKVFLLHHTLLKGVVLLHYYFWSFLVCLFGGLCVFGLLVLLVLHLVLLVLHLSTRCEIYLSYHAQNMQAYKLRRKSSQTSLREVTCFPELAKLFCSCLVVWLCNGMQMIHSESIF